MKRASISEISETIHGIKRSFEATVAFIETRFDNVPEHNLKVLKEIIDSDRNTINYIARVASIGKEFPLNDKHIERMQNAFEHVHFASSNILKAFMTSISTRR